MELFLPFNAVNRDRVHTAEDIAALYASVLTNGVHPYPDDSLLVEPAPQGGMRVAMRPGRCVVNGRLGAQGAAKVYTVPAADPAQARVDCLVVQCDYAQRWITEYVKAGVPGTGQPPQLQRDGDRYELALARITVPAGATAITAAYIEDTRNDPAVCGRVNSLVQVDTRTMRQEMFSGWQDWLDDRTQTWDAWFARIKLDLSGNVAVNLAGRIEEADANAQSSIAQARKDLAGAGKLVSLLDNDDFSIWQRGTEFPGLKSHDFFADRWKVWLNDASESVRLERSDGRDTGFQALYTTQYAWCIGQTIEDPHNRLSGKVLTAVIQTRFPALVSMVTLMKGGQQITMQRATGAESPLVFRGILPDVEDGTADQHLTLWVHFYPAAAQNVSVDRVVLMLGSHTEMPPPVHPAVTLLRCMRYYQVIQYQTVHWYYAYALTGFLLPVPMRTAPTVQGCLVTSLEDHDTPLDVQEVHVTPERVWFFHMGPAFASAPMPKGYYASVVLYADYLT